MDQVVARDVGKRQYDILEISKDRQAGVVFFPGFFEYMGFFYSLCLLSGRCAFGHFLLGWGGEGRGLFYLSAHHGLEFLFGGVSALYQIRWRKQKKNIIPFFCHFLS